MPFLGFSACQIRLRERAAGGSRDGAQTGLDGWACIDGVNAAFGRELEDVDLGGDGDLVSGRPETAVWEDLAWGGGQQAYVLHLSQESSGRR